MIIKLKKEYLRDLLTNFKVEYYYCVKKFILFFILLVLFLSFVVFLLNSYRLQKNYFNSKNNQANTDTAKVVEENIEKPSFYQDYTKEIYEMALADRGVIVLYFTSNWCKECLDQDFLNNEVFNELTLTGVVGQKIHILDSESTAETGALAKKFDIVKEQSFVILNKDGAVESKYTGAIDKELLKEKIKDAN